MRFGQVDPTAFVTLADIQVLIWVSERIGDKVLVEIALWVELPCFGWSVDATFLGGLY